MPASHKDALSNKISTLADYIEQNKLAKKK